MRTLFVLTLFAVLSGCAVKVEPPPPPPPPVIDCTPPGWDSPTCETLNPFSGGDSAFWGPGPNTYCTADDGSEWHLATTGAFRYELEPGTEHSPAKILCDVVAPVDPACTVPAELIDCQPETEEVGSTGPVISLVCGAGDGVTQWRFQGSTVQIHEVVALNASGHHDRICELSGGVPVWRAPAVSQ